MLTVSLRKVFRNMFRDLLEVYKYEATVSGDAGSGAGGRANGFTPQTEKGVRAGGFFPHTETLKQVTVLTIKALKSMQFDF